MSIEDEIKTVDTMVKDVELYVKTGVWHPDRELQIAKGITETDIALNQLMSGHSMKTDVLTDEQMKIISDLLKRFNNSKDKLPSPP